MPSKKFADGAEIFEHCRRIGKHFGLYDGAIFPTQVTRAALGRRRSSAGGSSTDRGDDIRARFVVMAQGSFNRPKLPGIPGIKDFKGHIFHSARWDYEYTGGDASGGLDKLARQARRARRHGCHGCAARSVPGSGRPAPLRLPAHAVDSRRRNNTATDQDWAKSLQPGWQKERQAQLPRLVTFEGMVLGPARLRLRLLDRTRAQHDRAARRCEDPASLSIEQFMASGRKKTTSSWSGCGAASTASSTIPRPPRRSSRTTASCASGRASNDDYLPTFNRPNVTLVDVSESKGVERADREGHCRQWCRVRSRLHHLRQWFRDLHRYQPSIRIDVDRGPRRRCRSSITGGTDSRRSMG